MSFTGITVSASGAIAQKCGAYFNPAYTDDMMTLALIQAEASLGADTLYDWAGNWETISGARRALVTAITSATVAIEAIRYDLDAVGKSAAISMINSLSNEIEANKKILRDKDKSKFAQTI